MQPEFGCDVWKVLFEPMDGSIIENQIENYILDAVETWLPYLTITNIIFDYDDNDIDLNRIILEIKFALTSNPNLTETITINVNK
jgi:hypothetical protein